MTTLALGEKVSFEEDLLDFETAVHSCKKYVELYRQDMDGANKIQKESKKVLRELWYELKRLQRNLRQLRKKRIITEREYRTYKYDIMNERSYLRVLGSELPNRTNNFLSFFLGNVKFYITDYTERVNCKIEYEDFKMVMLIIFGLFSIVMFSGYLLNLTFILKCLSIPYHLIPFYYYLSLTMRETVLKANGSNINNWWTIHHYISIFLSAFLLFWPFESFQEIFASRFYAFAIYTSIAQLFRHFSQKWHLSSLRSLGKASIEETINSDTPVEHFYSRLKVQLPFTIIMNLLLFFLSIYLLVKFITVKNAPKHCLLSSILFLSLAIGNTYSITRVVINRLHSRSIQSAIRSIPNISLVIAKKLKSLNLGKVQTPSNSLYSPTFNYTKLKRKYKNKKANKANIRKECDESNNEIVEEEIEVYKNDNENENKNENENNDNEIQNMNVGVNEKERELVNQDKNESGGVREKIRIRERGGEKEYQNKIREENNI
ncbi:transmembrane protein induced by tumor necrosis factor alpha [Anaeramoeba flamelloides]|uniref:Transmembrane protein induced by tumor necrosis factor alpha n=1 Tax=Anaeramoeba flamelloides TaxID=1746091 RepID=A0AAV7YSI1_9EUKA|nr:transmembrane protein induced by tumor necrosis factor alpha [Anaeramoeba flamelloides]